MINQLKTDLLKKHLGPFLFCFITLMFLLLMQFLVMNIDNLIGKEIPLAIILELIATNLAYMVVLATPMAVLIATLMAFGKFSELNELTALRASGVNPFHVMRPVLIASIILTVMLTWFSDQVLPDANHKSRSLFIDIKLKKPAFELQTGNFYQGIEGYTFLVREIDGETDSLYNITLYEDPSNTRDRRFIRADRGILKSKGGEALELTLHDGQVFSQSAGSRGTTNQFEKSSFSEHRMILDLADLSFMRSDPTNRSRGERTMSSKAMMQVVDSLRSEYNNYKITAAENMLLNTETTETDDGEKVRIFENNESFFKPEIIVNTSGRKLNRIESTYPLINRYEDPVQQLNLIREASRQLNDYQSWFSNVESNAEYRKKRAAQFLVEIHKKLSIPIACLVFVLFGAPIGIMTRNGNFGIAALIGSVVLTFYWVSIIQGEKLADLMYISPFWGMWTFNIIMSVTGIILILNLTTELQISKLFRRSHE
ncbi:LptF/LptG family permease [Balneola sp. MJW-20]|uniref:LptF/LptG family permease n=1 Tax=Gracilimonas aurantiaca TaxID=3234185 RepID=UPI0034666C97